MTKKIFALVMVISVLGAFLAGCGSKDESAAGGTTAGATTTGTTSGEATK